VILLKEGQNIVFVSEDTPSITPYVRHYLTAIKVNGLYQFKYHGNAIDVFRKSNFFKDSQGVLFNDTTLDIFIFSISEKPYIQPVSQYSMNGNNTQTVISNINTPVKIQGNTISSSVTQKFINTDNRATCVNDTKELYKITYTLSCESGNNNQIGCYIAIDGTPISESEIYITTNGNGKFESVSVQLLQWLSYGQYVEGFIENNTGGNNPNNITVTEMNVIIK